jgi:PadR family transcriptional regulator, regulatory protein PadR
VSAQGPESGNWLSQLRRGLLELCILNLLDREPAYGYQLVKHLTSVPGLVISEGTIYPLLGRLSEQGLVASTLVESPQGPARRTYVLTAAGRRHVKTINQTWQVVTEAVIRCMTEPMTSREIEK